MEFEGILPRALSSEYALGEPTSFTTPPDDTLQINFLFSCCRRVSIRHQNSTQIIRGNPLLMHSSISRSLSQFHDYQQTYNLFYENTKNWYINLDPHVHIDIFDKAYMHAKEALRSMPPAHTHLYVKCSLVVHHNIFVQPTSIAGMIPADDLSIEALETMNVSSGSCCICLEEFCEGEDLGASMPCQHVFHRDCISKWLGISHFCPVCRFQMPPAA